MAPASCVWWPLANVRCVCIIKTDSMTDSSVSLRWRHSFLRSFSHLDGQRKVTGPSHSMRERWFKAVALSGNTWLGGHGCHCCCWSCCNCCRSNRTYQDIKYRIGFLYIAYVAACLPRLNEVMSSLLEKKKKQNNPKQKNKLQKITKC